MLSYSTVLLRYLTTTVELSKLIVAPPAVTFIGIAVAFTNPLGTLAIAVTLPEISSALLASLRLEIIVVFAFCVENPCLELQMLKLLRQLQMQLIQ